MGFLKSFLGALLALVVFSIVLFFVFALWLGKLTTANKVETGAKAVLYIDLNQALCEQKTDNPLAAFGADEQYDRPGLYDLIRMIRYAKTDTAIKGIFLKCNGNANGFAATEEIRNALSDFKTSKKFIYAYGDVISQKGYYPASVADKIYCNPKGGVDWRGYAAELTFLKGALDKLDIEPQIFYAGKFKSATEPLRADKMTDANRLQMTELLTSLYNRFLYRCADARNLDTGTLRKCVNEHLLEYAQDALQYGLVDGLRYDDEVKDEVRNKLHLGKHEKINFITADRYAKAVRFPGSGENKIALIYAQGDIVDGKGGTDQVGGDTYRTYIRKARFDESIKAIVIRINSGGGSSMASENIWREITITRKEKPVIISFGDVAASGAYYLSCNADSIFAQPNTITGSIGVFSVLPNLQKFFNNKLGITFDRVKTAPDADELSITKPLTEMQKRYLQNEVDSIYHDFKKRVADGRNRSIEYIDSIAQGRVWIGEKALGLGLVDRMGSLQDAIDCAARMAKLKEYRLKEYPEEKSWLEQVFGGWQKSAKTNAIKEELGEDEYKTFQTIKSIRSSIGIPQARLPFDLSIE